MGKVVFDGGFLGSEKFTGAERYAVEILYELDKIVEKGRFEILIKNGSTGLIRLDNIKKIEIKSTNKISWKIQMIHHIKKGRALYINFTNGIALNKKSIITLHDIYAFYGVYNKEKSYIWKKKFFAKFDALVAKKVVTVSEFSKKTMLEKLPIKENKISVIGNGWQHIKSIEADDSILNRNGLKNKSFYFFVGRLVHNKNIKWIFEVADRNPSSLFVVTGDLYNEEFEFYKGKNNNIIYTGFVNDSEMKSLFQNCKAFLFPSLMEGFGIPPMEALYNGAQIIIANTSSLPEIYGKSAHYINPYKYDYDLDALLQEPVEDAEIVLNKYSWKKSAEAWYELINSLET